MDLLLTQAAAGAVGGAAPTGFTWGGAFTIFMVLAFLVACVLLILTVLIQKPQGGGLAGAFGSGAGSGQTAFGTRTGDALTVATIVMFVFYLGTAIGLTYLIRPSVPSQGTQASAPADANKPAAPAPAGGAAPADAKPADAASQSPAGAPVTPGATPATTPAATPAATPPATPAATPAPASPAKPDEPK